MRDRIYEKRQDLVDFAFDEAVVRVFPDMIRRSVPGYEHVIAMTSLVAAHHATPGSLCYDLGCSLGATAVAMQRGIEASGCTIIAIDDSPAMIAAAIQREPHEHGDQPIRFACADLRDVIIRDASLVALQYSLQFVATDDRLPLLERIHAGLLANGALLLSEKIVANDPAEQRYIDSILLEFKRANGYSELEISQKRAALEHTLVAETLPAQSKRLEAAGFRQVIPWLRSLNFISLIALP